MSIAFFCVSYIRLWCGNFFFLVEFPSYQIKVAYLWYAFFFQTIKYLLCRIVSFAKRKLSQVSYPDSSYAFFEFLRELLRQSTFEKSVSFNSSSVAAYIEVGCFMWIRHLVIIFYFLCPYNILSSLLWLYYFLSAFWLY